MGYAMYLAGELSLPAGQWEAFRAAQIAPQGRRGWCGVLVPRGEADGDPPTVADYLKALPRTIITVAGSWLEIVQDAPTLSLCGQLVEDDFNDHGTRVAEVFRLGGDHGGTGSLFFLEEQVLWHPQEPELCYAVRVTPRKSKVEHLSEDEQAEAMASERFAPVRARVEAALVRAHPKAKKATTVRNPFTGEVIQSASPAKKPIARKPARKKPVG